MGWRLLMLRACCLTAALATLLISANPPAAGAQTRSRDAVRSGDGCDAGWGDSSHVSYCEVREETIGGAAPLDVDAGANGGIKVTGWDRGDVLVRTVIRGYGETDADARRMVAGVHVETATHIRALGPEPGRRESWSVQFELHVPRRAQLALHTNNGGIAIGDFQGIAEFRAQNGGVTLKNVGGEIKGETTNGGLTIDLNGDRWDGMGLDVTTHNGGIKLTLPERYSAELETGTTNGRVTTDFPITVQGQLTREIHTTLGSGGVKIRAMTTNGGVTIQRR
jgi:Putative adhesin